MMACVEEARAKVNLALHVTGRRADGYHLLDTLVVFPPVGDRLTAVPAEAADSLHFSVTGPGEDALAGTAAEDNLVVRAARGMATVAAARRAGAHPDTTASADAFDQARSAARGLPRPGVAVTLEKHLPVAAGVGGGSADAAAAIRLLARLWEIHAADPAVAALAARLGADVPICLAQAPLRARGIGDEITPMPSLPSFPLLLVNPGRPLATPAVFKALANRQNPPLPEPIPTGDPVAFLAWLEGCRNDLQSAAISVEPAVGEVLRVLERMKGVRLARMSGSGATCFALFDLEEDAREAGERIIRDQTWWVG